MGGDRKGFTRVVHLELVHLILQDLSRISCVDSLLFFFFGCRLLLLAFLWGLG